MLICWVSPDGGEEEDGHLADPGERVDEADGYWKKEEAFFRGSTVSLGDRFSSGTVTDQGLPPVHYPT